MRIWLLFIFSIAVKSPFAQIGNQVFNDQVLHRIEVTTPLADWLEVLDQDFAQNLNDPASYPEVYRPCVIKLDGAYIVNSGFRERGNFSNSIVRSGDKKRPLKIAFDAFVNQSYNGVQKIILNNFSSDPSLVHDALAYSMFRELGIPAPRTAYAQLFVNEEYIGLYLMVENVDKTFLKIHYGSQNNDGNLYKTDREAKVYLNDLGDDAATYIGVGLKLTTNESTPDYSRVIDFIHFLNQPERLDFDEEFIKRFDIENYLKVLAVEKFVRSWDNYWAGGNNFYLYEHPDGQYRWIPWDMNETFQDLRNLSWTSWLDGYWVPNKQMGERPLIAAIFKNEKWLDHYLNLGCELIHKNFTIQNISERVVFWHNLVAEAYQMDPNKINTYEDFEKSLTEQHMDQVQLFNTPYAVRFHYPGLFPLIQEQREWVSNQLAGWDIDCPILNQKIALSVFPNPGNDYFIIQLPSSQIGQLAQWSIFNEKGELVKRFPWMLMIDNTFSVRWESLEKGVFFIRYEGVDGTIGRAKWISL